MNYSMGSMMQAVQKNRKYPSALTALSADGTKPSEFNVKQVSDFSV